MREEKKLLCNTIGVRVIPPPGRHDGRRGRQVRKEKLQRKNKMYIDKQNVYWRENPETPSGRASQEREAAAAGGCI